MTIQVLQQAEQLFRAGRRRAAIDLLEEHMAESPGDRQAASVLGRIYVNNSQPDRAAFWLKHALQIDHQAGLAGSISYEKSSDPNAMLDQDDMAFMAANDAVVSQCDLSDEYGLGGASAENGPVKTISNGQQIGVQVDTPQPVSLENVLASPEGSISQNSLSDDDLATLEDLSLITQDPAEEKTIASATQAAIDWQDYALDGTAVDQAKPPTSKELPVSRLTHLERARQVASRLASEVEWGKRDIPILVEILAYHKCHGKTITALRTLLIEEEVTPAELAVLHDLRMQWGSGGYNRVYNGNKARDGWPNISWQLALRLARVVRADNAEEILLFVDDCFEDWCDTPGLLYAYPIFIHYLDRVIDSMHRSYVYRDVDSPPFVDYRLFPDDEDEYSGWRLNKTKFQFGYEIISSMPEEDSW